MKVLCMYLPQFHEIAENNKWWEMGYTEWSAVKGAVPLFKNHYQPRIPLNHNYYDLSEESADTWRWQTELANKYGVYGFCIYHYWFEGKQLLEKPMEILLKHPEINCHYSICWANETWTKTWYGLEKEVLVEQTYGKEKEWKKHFEYLLQFFKDERYIKIENRPMLHIYHTVEIEELDSMRRVWDKLSRENGFDGIYLVAGNTSSQLEDREELIDAYYNFEPGFTLKHRMNFIFHCKYFASCLFKMNLNHFLRKKKIERKINIKNIYQQSSKEIKNCRLPVFYGTFPMWDNTPRRQYRGLIYKNASPELFKKNLKKLKSLSEKSELDFVYINAWNEWGEGAYLEPDELYGYRYLETIRTVLNSD